MVEQDDHGWIYADHAATTPCDPTVIALMGEVERQAWGNPSSIHYPLGRLARGHIDQARQRVAELLSCHDDEIIFTSGATEGCNAIIKGIAAAMPQRQIISVCTEHPAVLRSLQAVAQAGIPIRILPVTNSGLIDPELLSDALHSPTSLVSLMLVNNQTGVVHDLATIAERVHAAGALLMSDISQGLGRMGELQMRQQGVDFAVCSAHKIHGPKGCGAIMMRRGLNLQALIDGGGQEKELRSGTENVAAITGFGLACGQQLAARQERLDHLTALQTLLESGLRQHLPELQVYGAASTRAAGISMLGAANIPPGWLRRVPQIACSAGSSCASRDPGPNPVLAAMGVSSAEASNAIRLSLSHQTSVGEIQTIIARLANCAYTDAGR